ncbi:MBOAT family protein [Butyrivibrio sp. XB500-5]|uniref:MBOAT family O-acyltransferase n=1 Tax=Butyrivibrio sp. XB500-5 TaxID=2364880 RepID=UPI000EAA218D|nr:MBOAT family O-acyltransferase [Butyrivibrio sp. XB500-5]RKM59510.1 MBOAT family protein [Butyrivibrio sp. XB500-5]
MSFISYAFMAFLPIAVLINFIVPRKYRYIWLLIVSLAFYATAGIGAAIILVISMASVYAAGLLLGKYRDKAKQIFISCLVFNLGILFVFKYLNFFMRIVGLVSFGAIDDIRFNLILPIGLSFYILKSAGYLIDVYRGDIEAEKDPVMLALFISFFPQIVAGPIERAGNMLPQFKDPTPVDFDRFRNGFLQILWGYFLKLVVAERLAIFVNTVFDTETELGINGAPALVAILFYTFQIYTDFAAYSHISIGVARILGIDVMKNFESPYLAMSIAEFWRRWHISLSSWLRDYLYIPLGGNRKGTIRKYINIMIVFAVSGLWHGANFTFVVWGLLHGLYQVIGKALTPARDKIIELFNIGRYSFSHRVVKTAVTFFLVNYAWVFFRADSIGDAVRIAGSSFYFTPWKLVDKSMYGYGLSRGNFLIAVAGIVLVIIVDLYNHRGVVIRENILKQGLWLRWIIMITGIVLTVILGIWGQGYNVADFIYKQF